MIALPGLAAVGEYTYDYKLSQYWNQHINFDKTKLFVWRDFYKTNVITIPLTVIHLKNSKWQLSDIKIAIERTKKIYKQECEITLSPLLLVSTNHAMGSELNSDDPVDYIDIKSIIMNDAAYKPAVFMLDKDLSDIPTYGGTSWSTHGTAILFNSYPVYNRKGLIVDFKHDRHQQYEIMAHELAHLLLNEGHNNIRGNILNQSRDQRTNRFTQAQCSKLRDTRYRRIPE